MKKGYKRLLVFEFLVGIVLFLNSFVWNILSRHVMNVFLLVLIIIFRVFFGLEKDRHRYVKDILMDVFIFLVVTLMLYYLFGIIISFVKIDNYYSVKGFLNFILPTICLVIFREYLRYNVLCKASGNKITIIASILLFIWIGVSTDIYYIDYSNSYDIFKFFALYLLPAISSNLVYSYISIKSGYKPVMLYSLVMSLYVYLIPIIPNPNEYVKSVIDLLLPTFMCYRMYLFFKKANDEEIDRNYRKSGYVWLIISFFIVVVLVYFTSGYFSFWAIAVASGSMEPAINKGDVAIVKKIDNNYASIKKGDVLAFKYDNVMIVHRVINIVIDKERYYFYTKGDANHDEDKFVIEEDMVIGVVNFRVPFVGVPTVWLNEL